MDEKISSPSSEGWKARIEKRMKRNMYQWHRVLGIITIVPVLFWCLSGFMHPFMAHWFKPTIAHEVIKPVRIDKNLVRYSIQDVLKNYQLTTIRNFRMVTFNDQLYYQIKDTTGTLHYVQATNGQLLPKGDVVYAEWMARFFLNDQNSKIASISKQTGFSQEYKYVNRLLPVWKVSFERDDKMDVYVETSSSRLGTFNPVSRKAFLWVFDTFHNWSFVGNISNNVLRISVMIFCLSIIIASALSGIVIYGFLWKKFKKPGATKKTGTLRQYHRQIGIAIALFTLTFAGSGAYHATRKLNPNTLPAMVYEPSISAAELPLTFANIAWDWKRLENISVVRMGEKIFYQASYGKTEQQKPEKVYVNAATGQTLPNGDIVYASYLTDKFAGIMNQTSCDVQSSCCEPSEEENSCCLSGSTPLLKTEVLSKFESREYGFVFKRLPVVQIAYDTPDKSTYYVETATSRLAAHITNADRYEGYSFAIFHKFLFMDWAGKTVRDVSMLLAAFSIVVVGFMGLILFIRK
ncbi:MAG: PepSY protein [Cytophagaceae bacterium]|jgi:hypothetical protein|nr:PepSY protein [Cytophagaceae bacterium]